MENGKAVVADTGAVETVWIVQKLDWKYNDMWHVLQEDIPLKAFVDRAKAQKYCDQLTAQEQDNLVQDADISGYFGGLARMTTLSEEKFLRRLKAEDLPTPRFYEGIHSRSWWNRTWPALSQEKRTRLWRLFDLIQFYEVVEVELLP